MERSPEFCSEEYSLKCQTSQLNEDLGLVDYVFTDKTGTLTKNNMVFRSLFANNKRYGSVSFNGGDRRPRIRHLRGRGFDQIASIMGEETTRELADYEQKIIRELKNEEFKNKIVLDIINCCHDVIVKTDSKTGERTYNASSPDELALLQFAEAIGLEFEGLDDHNMELVVYNSLTNTEERFKRLAVFRFTSERSRMSVIVRDLQTNKVLLMVKGADGVVMERSVAYSGFELPELKEALHDYAAVGLRTLVYAYKEIEEDQASTILLKIREIEKIMGHDKEIKMAEFASDLERDLTIVGVTAVEDELQDDVRGTLQALRDAHIKVWMLTGDKLETAINIGYSSGLLKEQDILVSLKPEEDLVSENDINNFFSELEVHVYMFVK